MSKSRSSTVRQPACSNAEGPCGMCPSCLFSSPRPSQPTPLLDLWKITDESRRSFVVGLVVRCRSVPVLENIQSSLRLTSWNLLNYAPSKGKTLPELYARLNRKTRPSLLIREIWEWFDGSPEWVQTRYLCLLLLRCDPELLSMAKHLIGVVVTRLQRQLDVKCCSSKQPASEDDSAEDAVLSVLPVPPSKSSFGLGKPRDFIGILPAELSKRILGLLDEATLKRCMKVCKDWRHLAGETMEEMRFRRLYQEQVEAMMKRYKGVHMVSPSYARMVDVAVPAKHHESGDVKSTHLWPFEEAYANIRTRTVRMEERNIYCGAYFTSVLIDDEDPHRVVDYKGGPLLSTASKDRAVRLLYVATAAKHVALMKGHVGSIRVVLLCPERHLVITASCDSSIRCWSVRTDQCVLVLYGHSSMINCLDIHADRLVSGAKDCTAKVWSLQTEKHLEDFNFKHRSSVRCVKINATAVFSSCDRGVVKLWDAENASLLRVIDAHGSAVRCMFVDEWHLLTADTNGQVMAWSSRCETKGCLMTFSHPKEVKSLTLAYLRVVTGCVDGKIRIFNFLTGDCLRTILVEAETTGRMLSLHFCENNILVNATSCVKLYQFAKVFWDYDEPADKARNGVDGGEASKQEPPSNSARASHMEQVAQHWKSLLHPLTPDAGKRTRRMDKLSSPHSEKSLLHCHRRRPLTSVRNPQRPANQSLTNRLPHLQRDHPGGRNTM
ncbi:F-box and WD repeat domain containing protein 10B isoform X1 [Phyllopteryx taeniolatus]|uniref:F-box and WD repeat domain containing protein 10B isoform X1 n=1 Tax=Phyllopteryx taeniolatus TaxID=161469 RepID=UPI002AD3B6C1|nr:F-box and WD repeat domain containing protein 10B isoform X1 [Phyllopteryx taeniolatus]